MVNIKINNYFVRFIFIKREVKNFDNKGIDILVLKINYC